MELSMVKLLFLEVFNNDLTMGGSFFLGLKSFW
jgi:hypothetical protein